MKLLVKAAAVAMLALAPVSASALAVIGGNTRVVLGSAAAGLDVGLSGSATLVVGAPGLTINFPITGGTLDPGTLAGNILHDGSGISLSNGTNTLLLTNFIIDTTTSLLLGDVSLNGSALGADLPLFSFDLATVSVPELTDLDNPLLALNITPTAAGALTAAFGLADTSGVTLGNAATAPQLAAVPEPESWALLLLGFGAVGVTVRRRRDTAVTA